MSQSDEEGPRARMFERANETTEDVEKGPSSAIWSDPKSGHEKEALHLLRIYRQKPELLITLLG